MPHALQTRRGRQLVHWIADNDNDAEMHRDTVASQMTVKMLAHVYGIESTMIANEIIRIRAERDGSHDLH